MVSVGFVLFKFSQAGPSVDRSSEKTSRQSQKVRLIESDSKNHEFLHATKEGCNVSKPLFDNRKIRSISELKPALQKTLDLAIVDHRQILELVHKKDENSSITAFILLRSCYPYGDDILSLKLGLKIKEKTTREFCTNLPNEVAKNPLALLDNAAKAGSSEAKLMYAMNVQSMLKIMKFNGAILSKNEEQAFIKIAEAYGNSAAIDGIEEAYWFMASAYFGGVFGDRDYTKAYAFTLPQMRIKQDGDAQERLDLLYRELTMPQIRQAQMLAFGCQIQSNKPGAQLNPFQ